MNGTLEAIVVPAPTPESPVTLCSAQAAFAALTVKLPAAPTLSTKIVNVAFCTCAAVRPAGSVVKSNCSRPTLPELPTDTVCPEPKLEALPGMR